MNTCKECMHAEMCKWIDELEGRGCDFLSQEPCDDAEQIDYHDDFETASRKIHDYEERQKQNDKKCGSYNNTNTFKSCSNCKLIGTDSCYMVCGGSKSLYKPKQKLEPCDDAISRILKRMWNCRGKHTTSVDKVAMEQIIRDELSVTQKSGKWHIAHGCYEDRFWCSCGYIRIMDSRMNEWKYCPVCGGAKMVEPQESEE